MAGTWGVAEPRGRVLGGEGQGGFDSGPGRKQGCLRKIPPYPNPILSLKALHLATLFCARNLAGADLNSPIEQAGGPTQNKGTKVSLP